MSLGGILWLWWLIGFISSVIDQRFFEQKRKLKVIDLIACVVFGFFGAIATLLLCWSIIKALFNFILDADYEWLDKDLF
jgi:hypothetical protein